MWRKIQNYFIRWLNLIKKKEQCKDKFTANLHWIYSRLTKIEDMSEKYFVSPNRTAPTSRTTNPIWITIERQNITFRSNTLYDINVKYIQNDFIKFKFYFIKLNSSTSFTSTENKLHNVPVYIKYFEKVLVWRSVL